MTIGYNCTAGRRRINLHGNVFVRRKGWWFTIHWSWIIWMASFSIFIPHCTLFFDWSEICLCTIHKNLKPWILWVYNISLTCGTNILVCYILCYLLPCFISNSKHFQTFLLKYWMVCRTGAKRMNLLINNNKIFA